MWQSCDVHVTQQASVHLNDRLLSHVPHNPDSKQKQCHTQ